MNESSCFLQSSRTSVWPSCSIRSSVVDQSHSTVLFSVKALSLIRSFQRATPYLWNQEYNQLIMITLLNARLPYYFAHGTGARYCDERVCSLTVCSHISKTHVQTPDFTKFWLCPVSERLAKQKFSGYGLSS